GSNTAYLTGNQNITLSGDVSGSGTTAISTTIGSNTVTNTKLSDMAQNTLKGRYSSGSGDPEDLTPAQALNVLGITAPTGDNLGNHTATTALDMVGNAINRAVQINTNGDHLELMTNRVDDNTYEWIGYYSGGTRQGIMLWDGAWSGANNLTNEFSLTAENSNLLTLNTNNNHIALMPKNGNVGIGTASPNGTLDVRGATFVGSSNTNQQIKFTDGWSGYPDGSNGSEIANDVGSYKALMIVGNKSAGGSRQVKLWDYLTVNGGMSVTGLGSGIVKATGGVLGIANAGDLPSHTHTWSQVTSKPAAWLDGSNLIADNANFNNSVPSGFYQGYNATNAPGTSWYNMLNVRHSNPGNDHGFQIAASYYDEKIWTRTYQGGTGANDGTFTPWAELQTSRSSSNANWTMAMHGQSSDDDLGFGWTSVVDDGIWGTVMPFSIQINGTNYSDLTLNSNGTVVFGSQSANLGYSYGTLPNGVTTLPFIAWYWRDMSTRYRYGTVGSSPNRVFIIDFDSNAYGTSDDVDGQIEIHETSGLINVFYRVMEPKVNGQNATIGFQLNGGNSAKAYPITYNGKVFDDNRNPQSWSVSPVR
ncbi:MAG: pyocin knob domain-containing protein, partial [Chitinophagales bacterium]|nr:pyocin knob domain-containing protein [Chitinophagales bacterium]